MPLDPHHSRIIKHAKQSKLQETLPTIAGIVVQATLSTLLPFLFDRSLPKPMRTRPLSGHEYVHQLLNCGNPRRIQEVLRMKLEVFHFLCMELKNKCILS